MKHSAKELKILSDYKESKSQFYSSGVVHGGRILVVDAVTPTPDKDSGSIDIFNYMKIFIDLGFQVTFIPKDLKHCGAYTDSLTQLGIECIHKPLFKSFANAIKEFAPASKFVLLYRASIAAPLIDTIRQYAPQTKLLFNPVDLHFLRKQRQAEISKSPIKFLAAKRMKKMELNTIRKVDASILLNANEIELVKNLIPEAQVFHIPMPREIPGPSNTPWEKRKHIVFIGGYKHHPNTDAVLFFVNNVWPYVRSLGFRGCFIIAGSNVPNKISSLATNDIVVKGYVSDLSELFGSCRLSVAPLRYGAGMKGKVISSLCHGVPCIATSMAVEGSELIPGEHILVEDDPQKMANLIYRVYDDKALWERLSSAGLNFCNENCSIESIKKKLNYVLSSL